MQEEFLKVTNLQTFYTTPKGVVRAVDDVSFSIKKGETVCLIGESGCGKSTLGKTVARLISPTSGNIILDGVDISHMKRSKLQPIRKKLQFIFQDPFASLNPRSRIYQILEEPLIVHRQGNARERKEHIHNLIKKVGIQEGSLKSFPHEFSGGQRQRITLARALMLNPKLIICDEPVSALDVSVQAQILNLLSDLQKEFNYSSLFITHDFSVAKYISDRIIVMYLGKIVEISNPEQIWKDPLHPYTKALISAVPIADPENSNKGKRILLEGDLPSPVNPPLGCYFHPRCSQTLPCCSKEPPPLQKLPGERVVACHLYKQDYENLDGKKILVGM